MGPLFFDQPLWLLALLLVPVAARMWLRPSRAATRPRSHRRFALLRAALIGVLALALAGPSWHAAQPGMDLIVVVDRSASMLPAARSQVQTVLDTLPAHAGPDQRIGVVVFGRNALIEHAPAADYRATPIRSVPDPTASNLEAALRVAAATADPSRSTRVLLLSDGLESRGEAVLAAEQLAARGIVVDAWPVGQAPEYEVIFEDLWMPERVSENERFAAQAVISSTHETVANLLLFQDGRLVLEESVSLQPGRNLFTFGGLAVDAGFAVYEARVDAPLDTFVQNNAVQKAVAGTGPARTLLVSGRPAQSEALWQALNAQGIASDQIPAEQLPVDPSVLGQYAGILLHNVAASQLSATQMAQLTEYVRRQGGGLIVIGGDQSFALGGYADTPLEAALPVTMQAPTQRLFASLALALVIDKSGSMNQRVGEGAATKLDLAKEAAMGVLDYLSADDLFGVVEFDSRADWTVPLQPNQHPDAIRARIARITADGGTHVYAGQELAYRGIRGSDAMVRHVIVLSDGVTVDADFEGLTRTMAAEGITVSAIALGEDADQDLMQRIAEWGGGRYYYSVDPYAVPSIFATEARIVTRPRALDRRFEPQVSTEADFLGGIARPLPHLDGLVVTYPKEAAALHLVDDEGLPVMASWRYGLGRVLAFTSGATPEWAADWLAWPSFAPFWAQAVRWSLRAEAAPGIHARLSIRDGLGVVHLDALDAAGEYLNFLQLHLELQRPDGEALQLTMEQRAPGRYEVEFEAEVPGAWMGSIVSADDHWPAPVPVGTTLPYPVEYARLDPAASVLQQVASITGGRVLTGAEPPEALFIPPEPVRAPVGLWPWLVGLASLLWLADVGARYVPTNARRLLAERWQALRGSLQTKKEAVAIHERLDDLVEQRRAAARMAPADDAAGERTRDARAYMARRRSTQGRDEPASPHDGQ